MEIFYGLSCGFNLVGNETSVQGLRGREGGRGHKITPMLESNNLREKWYLRILSFVVNAGHLAWV